MEKKDKSMKFSQKTKLILLFLLILINIILRTTPEFQEIVVGGDSLLIHQQINSITEFGYAKWIMSPLSFFGLTPVSYASAVLFLISGICQITDLEMRWVLYLYEIFLGISSIFFIYLFAGEIINDDILRFLASFGFSTSLAVLDLTTWTFTTRGLLVILGPLLLYLLIRIYFSDNKLTSFFIMIIIAILLFATHHLFYFLIPSFFTLISISIFYKYRHILKTRYDIINFFTFLLILIMFSIPFVFKKFIESSRYYPFYEDLFRYTGIYLIFVIGAIFYFLLKDNKTFGEWFLLLNSIFLVAFVYQQTYFKEFASFYLITLGSIGILNSMRFQLKKAKIIITIILISSIFFSGYYHFLHFDSGRFLEDSTYTTGKWLEYYGKNSSVSNDLLLGIGVGSVSEKSHVVSNSMILDVTYGFLELNLSEFEYFPVSSESFWYDVGKFKKDYAESLWLGLNMQTKDLKDLNISYVIENTQSGGNIYWNHGPLPSKLLSYTYNNGNNIYASKNIKIYTIE